MMDWGDTGWMKADFDIIRFKKRNNLQPHKGFVP